MRTRRTQGAMRHIFCLGTVSFLLLGSSADRSAGGPGIGMGPGISVDEALKSRLEGPLLVNGWLLAASARDVRLCTSLTESRPPACGGPSLAVEGLDLTSILNLREEQGRAWSQQPVQLLGTLENSVLVIAGRIRG